MNRFTVCRDPLTSPIPLKFCWCPVLISGYGITISASQAFRRISAFVREPHLQISSVCPLTHIHQHCWLLVATLAVGFPARMTGPLISSLGAGLSPAWTSYPYPSIWLTCKFRLLKKLAEEYKPTLKRAVYLFRMTLLSGFDVAECYSYTRQLFHAAASILALTLTRSG